MGRVFVAGSINMDVVATADRHPKVGETVAGSGDPVSPEACNRKIAVFDGRLRYDLRSEFKRIESVRAERGYQ